MGYKVKKIYIYQNGQEKQVRPPLPIPTSGLLGYRPLQSDLKDASNNGKNGSWYSGTGTFSTVSGKTGASVTASYTGGQNVSTQHIITPLVYDTLPFTLCGWIYIIDFNQGGQRPSLMTNGNVNANDNQFMLGCRYSDGWKVYLARTPNAVYLSSKPNTGTWYFWCVTYTGTTVKFYLNGSLTTTATMSSNNSAGGVFRLGCGGSGSGLNFFGGTNGYIRHCAVYNRALTDAEVLQFYNQTS